jgi:hypothetical protein
VSDELDAWEMTIEQPMEGGARFTSEPVRPMGDQVMTISHHGLPVFVARIRDAQQRGGWGDLATAFRQLNEMPILAAIVRDLAANHPGAASEVHGDPYCTLCDGATQDPPVHDPDCPWRRAVEWVQAHPANEGAG